MYLFADEPLDVCIDKHEALMKDLINKFKADKPDVLTLTTKTEWIRKACIHMNEKYPESAAAFKRCYTVYNGAKKIKDLDAAEQEEYKQQKATNTIPMIEGGVKVARLPDTNVGVLTRVNPIYLELPKGPPQPKTQVTEEDLLDINNAFDLYYSFEYRLRGKNPRMCHKDEIFKMYQFVDDLLSGNDTSFYNYMMSMQIALRVTNGEELPEELLSDPAIQPSSGIRNPYIDMQDRDAVQPLFFHPDRDVNTSWPTVCVGYKDRGRFELILPDYVAMKMWRKEALAWHREVFCPAYTNNTALKPEWNESGFLDLDGRMYPMSVLNKEPEFTQVLQLHNRQQEDRHRQAEDQARENGRKHDNRMQEVQPQKSVLDNIRCRDQFQF